MNKKIIVIGGLLVSTMFTNIDSKACSISTPSYVEKNIEEVVLENQYSKYDIDLIALVTMAEAEGESELGKRLVIDTILNRVDNKYFPNSIYNVIYQPYQFSSMWNGRINRCYVKKDIQKLVIEEIANRTNSEVVFFRTMRYSDYGTPNIKVGNHYFSSYN